MAVAASCTQEIGSDSIDGAFRKYYLGFDDATKTEISGTGSTRHINWTEGDAIKYYTESGQESAVSAMVSIDGSSAWVEIPRGRTDEFINAVYGATQLKSSSNTENIMYVGSPVKNNQQYTSFSQAHICAAFSDDIENPNLQFHNAAAVFKFTSSTSIQKVVFRGNDNEVITGGSNGDLKITHTGGALTTEAAITGGTIVTIQTDGSESDFYIAIIPVAFTNGITVDCYDASLDLIVSHKTNATVNTLSSSGTPKIINLGKVQDWMANPQPVAVDLGLSVKWARYNVGATQPEEYGDYFSWGETSTKIEYKWANYSFGQSKNGPFSKYVIDSAYGTVDHKTVLDPADDAAHSAWGGDWRMPSQEEFEELKNNCSWTWTQKNGVNGYRVTSNVSGYTDNSIFLPANGMFSGASSTDVGTIGNYWSSSASDENTYYAISPYFSSSYVKSDNCYRYFGLGVRPVEGAVVPVSSIEMPKTLDLFEGRSATLPATVSPSNATYKGVTWASSDESIATVDAAGKVTAMSIGKATVTAYSAEAATTATCEVTVIETPKIDGHEYVDLGLPSGLKWASMNIGATLPEEYGEYFSWGETEPKSNYDWSTYKWCNGNRYKLTKYCTNSSYWDSTEPMDNKTTLDPEDDVAQVNWGGNWRMPTNAEWRELRNICIWIWTTQNGVIGGLLTGSNGNSIFFPATGCRSGANLCDVGSYGYYWSPSLRLDYSEIAYSNYFRPDGGSDYAYGSRYLGYSVRPVCDDRIHPKAIALNKTTLTLYVDDSEQLKATVYPNNATVISVTWSSDNTYVATVDEDGIVSAIAPGTATIISTTNDGGLTASCTVTVKIDLSMPATVEAVDLGLPSGLKWATMNIGAIKPEDYGEYFAWGETEPKSNYDWSTYKWCIGDYNKLTKYCTNSSYWDSTEPMDNRTTLDPEDDAARANWGGNWRMPTDAEWTELRENCTLIWTTQNGVNGRLVTSKANNNSIFLPAAGYRYESDLYNAGPYGYYWTSSLGTSFTYNAWNVVFYSNAVSEGGNGRYYGRSVRPITE